MYPYLSNPFEFERARKLQEQQFDAAYKANQGERKSTPEFNWEERKSHGINRICSLFPEATNIKSVGNELTTLIRFSDPSTSTGFYDAIKGAFDEHTDEFPAIQSFLTEYNLGFKALIDGLRHAIIGINISEI